MKKILFVLLISKFCFGQQSVTITPSDASHLKIFQKNGTAQLTIEGDGDGQNVSHSNIQLKSFVPESSFLSLFAYNNISFNDAFSIKHTKAVNIYGVFNRFGIYSGSNSIFEFDDGNNLVNTLALSCTNLINIGRNF